MMDTRLEGARHTALAEGLRTAQEGRSLTGTPHRKVGAVLHMAPAEVHRMAAVGHMGPGDHHMAAVHRMGKVNRRYMV